ncbi:MAG: MoxR family ATPase [Pseudomonadota bacterium]|jgi:MoxR-like ATPase|nr:MoxR family ATPase [Pseudomonadota bacterium]|tara:strand:+ start:153 stop:1064 length:912 start_codon:yes stop_codon:yes gene_type:complete
MSRKPFETVEILQAALRDGGYIANDGLSVSLFLALAKSRPLFLEGEAGVGKTEIAKMLSVLLARDLIRLQCYEGLDIAQAAYEWNYAQQLVEIQMRRDAVAADDHLFTKKFLIERPLLRALEPHPDGPPVLLIDELDRADEAFEAYLLELLSDWQITIPELGVIAATQPPIVIITSNRTREIHDALKRRCFYHWVDYPDAHLEMAILAEKAPEAAADLQRQIVGFVQALRQQNLFKSPGVAETIDWAQALVELNCVALDPQTVDSTMGVLLKYQDDISRIQGSEAARILSEVQASIVQSEMAR